MVTPRLTLAIFLLFQIFDGVFTFFAVRAYGFAAEANLLLATWMSLIGAGPAIIGAKIVAGACGGLLYGLRVHGPLLGVTAFYLVGVIAPWIVVLRAL